MKFSLLHPSRKRPQLAIKNAIDIIEKSKDKDLEYIICIDHDDPCQKEYTRLVQEANWKYKKITLLVSGSTTCVQALNCAAGYSTGDILIYVSEDFVFPLHWDREILAAVGNSDDFVLWVHDKIQNEIMTGCILSRKYYDYWGFVYHPAFVSMYADNFFTYLAKKRNKIIYANHLVIEHNHPSLNNGMPKDETFYRQNDSRNYSEGKATFDRLIKCY